MAYEIISNSYRKKSLLPLGQKRGLDVKWTSRWLQCRLEALAQKLGQCQSPNHTDSFSTSSLRLMLHRLHRLGTQLHSTTDDTDVVRF